MATTQPIRNKEDVNKLTAYYEELGQLRNQVLIVVALHTALRISDVLRLTWDNVYDFDNQWVKKSITLTEKKTGKQTKIALHDSIVDALTRYASQTAIKGGFIFKSSRSNKAIDRTQAYRIIRTAGEAVGIEERVSCHSLRKTFGYHAWKDDVPTAIIVEIYNHSSLAVTRRYLGVTQDDKDSVYLGIKFTSRAKAQKSSPFYTSYL
ncbi:MAG: tyrosine-type recombinase/integrase [Oscillospiraceae bacterium]|nr:tyrosine-type recombinase/integrase [Oscillospiraceae bacterium]